MAAGLPGRRLRHNDRGHQLVGSALGPPVAENEIGQRHPLDPGQRGQLDRGVEAEQRRHPVGRRRGVAEIAGDRPGVLDLRAADLAGGELQGLEQRRQIGRDQLAPGGAGADPPSVRTFLDAPEPVDRAEIEDVVAERPADPGRIEIGAAGDDRQAIGCKCPKRRVDRCRAQILAHRLASPARRIHLYTYNICRARQTESRPCWRTHWPMFAA